MVPRKALESLEKPLVAARDSTDRHAKSHANTMGYGKMASRFYLALPIALPLTLPVSPPFLPGGTRACALSRNRSWPRSIAGKTNEYVALVRWIGGVRFGR
jgi:hypothetical protein